MLLVSLVCPELRKYKCPTTEFAVEGLVRVRRSVPSPAAIRMTSTRTSNARNFPLYRGCLGFCMEEEGNDVGTAMVTGGRGEV
jgi:hypothetical protein